VLPWWDSEGADEAQSSFSFSNLIRLRRPTPPYRDSADSSPSLSLSEAPWPPPASRCLQPEPAGCSRLSRAQAPSRQRRTMTSGDRDDAAALWRNCAARPARGRPRPRPSPASHSSFTGKARVQLEVSLSLAGLTGPGPRAWAVVTCGKPRTRRWGRRRCRGAGAGATVESESLARASDSEFAFKFKPRFKLETNFGLPVRHQAIGTGRQGQSWLDTDTFLGIQLASLPSLPPIATRSLSTELRRGGRA
jgi:hypothetical protein